MKRYDLTTLPAGAAPDRLEYPHFPTLHQLVIWRNINLVPASRIASTLETTPEKVLQCANEMGLDVDESSTELFLERGFQTIIRRNWDILPYEQILDLLEWTPEKLAYILKEDDFFWVKLGFGKPRCAPVIYRELTCDEKNRTAEIKSTVQKYFQSELPAAAQPFDFLKHYGRRKCAVEGKSDSVRMVYSYSALYGDPLLDPEISSYPEAMLADYAACGVNAVWMQATLYTLMPCFGEDFPGSRRWQERLENLRKLVERGKKYAIDVILYFNEPRAMPPEFFEHVPFRMGARQSGFDDRAICCSDPQTLQMLEDAVCGLFTRVPDLGGVMTITMSENLTHCKSREEIDIPCPHCADVPVHELVLNVNCAIERGMHRAAPEAKFIVNTWAWDRDDENWSEKVISRLPAGTRIMAVSETGVETDCGGIKGSVFDYSISKPGPGKTASGIWRHARQYGHKPMAKIQLNNSWELSAVPYIPVADLIEKHLSALADEEVCDFMLCWTLGGFPGGNFELLNTSKEELAHQLYGNAAKEVLAAWSCFSKAFEKFPFHLIDGLYTFPGNYGPMSLLHKKCTFRKATMVGFPYDDLFSWRSSGHYPESVYRQAFSDICDGWKDGLAHLEKAGNRIQSDRAQSLAELRDISQVCYCHFKSTLNQINFVMRRRENLSCCDLYCDEISLAVTEWEIMRRDSRIGYEASNHYLFTLNDLMEKVVNCAFLAREEQKLR